MHINEIKLERAAGPRPTPRPPSALRPPGAHAREGSGSSSGQALWLLQKRPGLRYQKQRPAQGGVHSPSQQLTSSPHHPGVQGLGSSPCLFCRWGHRWLQGSMGLGTRDLGRCLVGNPSAAKFRSQNVRQHLAHTGHPCPAPDPTQTVMEREVGRVLRLQTPQPAPSAWGSRWPLRAWPGSDTTLCHMPSSHRSTPALPRPHLVSSVRLPGEPGPHAGVQPCCARRV